MTHGFSTAQMAHAFAMEFWNLAVSMIPSNWPIYVAGGVGVLWFVSKFFKFFIAVFVLAFAFVWWSRGGMAIR